MKTLILADSKPQQNLETILDENNFELIILAGDLEANDLLAIKDYPALKVGVYGNHCLEGYFEKLNVFNLHQNIYHLDNGLTISGLEGSPKYKPVGRFLYTDQQVNLLLQKMPRVDIFVSHTPGYGINDQVGSASHQGFKGLTKYIRDKQPRYFIHGHTYPNNRLTKYEQSEIIYCYASNIVDLN